MKRFALVAFASLLAGCASTPKPLPDEEPTTYNYMSRQDVANATMQCKSVKMTPRIIYKRLQEVGYPVPVQVFCEVRYDKLDTM